MEPEENRRGSAGRERGFFLVLLLLALAFTWIAMSPCLNNGFINWDETEYIIRNPRIKTLSFDSVKAIFSAKDLGMYSPLSTLTYALEYRFAGLNPRVYHATSLFLHLANTALVMILTRLLLAGVWEAFFIALLFGIHPAHVESVAWAAERKDVLYSFFYLSALSIYSYRNDKAWSYLLSLSLFVCSLLSKPMAVTLPIMLLLVDHLKPAKVKSWLPFGKIPFFVLSAAFAYALISPSSNALGMHWAKRLITPLYNMGFYVYTLLWPFNLSAMYVSPPGGKTVFYLFAAGAAAGIFLLWKRFRRDKEILFGAAFFTAALLPVLQFFPFGPVISADRYTYLSSLGVFIAAASCGRSVWRRLNPSHRQIMLICAACAIIALAVTSRVRCAAWKNGVSLWSDTLKKQPRAAAALINLCGAYVQENNGEAAADCLARAIKLYPENDYGYYHLGLLAAGNGDYGKAQEYFAKTLKISPCHAPALNNMGNIYLIKGETEKAERYYTRSAHCNNAYSTAYLNLGKLALLRKNTPAAVLFYEKALAADPADQEARARLNALKKPQLR